MFCQFSRCVTSESTSSPTSPPSSSLFRRSAQNRIRSVRHILPRHALLTLARALIVSKVDYCNSLLAGMSVQLDDQLQSVLNAAARLNFTARRTDHISPLLRDLHWLRHWACQVQVMCVGVPVSSRHGTVVPRRRPIPHVCWWQPPSPPVCWLSNSWWLSLPDARRSATVRFPWRLRVLGTVFHQPSGTCHHFCRSGAAWRHVFLNWLWNTNFTQLHFVSFHCIYH